MLHTLLAVLAILNLFPANTKANSPPAAYSCHAAAYILGTSQQETQILAGPGQQHAVLKKIPKQAEPPFLNIRMGMGNWLRISDVHSLDGHLLFGGSGWIYALKLATTTKVITPGSKTPLYSSPNPASKIRSEVDAHSEVKILYCQGAWLKVRAGKAEGWLSPQHQCANPIYGCR